MSSVFCLQCFFNKRPLQSVGTHCFGVASQHTLLTSFKMFNLTKDAVRRFQKRYVTILEVALHPRVTVPSIDDLNFGNIAPDAFNINDSARNK